MLIMEDQLLTLDETAQRLRVSKFTVKRWIETGQLEGVKVGVQWRVRSTAVARYLDRNTKPEDKK